MVFFIRDKSKEKGKILVVIPARKNSKGIPQKNKIIINNIPLIFHSVKKAKEIPIIDDICISTDDEEIISYAKILDVEYIKRSAELCEDDVPLAPVLYDAVEIMEERLQKKYNIVMLMQPTSPTVKVETIRNALLNFISDKESDTYLSVEKQQHLFWEKKNNTFRLFQKERINRQKLEPIYLETGSFFISRRNCINKNNFFGTSIKPIILEEDESIDIDTRTHISLAESVLKRKIFVFCVIGSKESGLGHIFRTLTLARYFGQNDCIFITSKQDDLAINIIASQNYKLEIIENWDQINVILNKLSPNIIINDILDTSPVYMNKLMEYRNVFPSCKIINFEDLGDGAQYADIVINALYETSFKQKNHYSGYKFVCVKDMFRYLPMKNIESIEKILVTFGGTDPSDITESIIPILHSLSLELNMKFEITIILGPGYSKEKRMNIYDLIQKNSYRESLFTIKEDIKEMALEMSSNDLIISSNGRTVYEGTSLGIPVFSLAQNEREELHLFSHFSKSVIYMGRFSEEKKDKISKKLKDLILNTEIIQNKNKEAKIYGIEIRQGVILIKKIIEELL